MKTINLSFAQILIISVSCVVLGMISVGYVAAQTASSTEEAATSTVAAEPVVEPEGTVLGEATTTQGTETPTPVVEEVTEQAPASAPEAQISAAAASVSDIMTLEQEHMSKYGRFLQVMPGNTLTSTESGSVQSKFGKALPENIRIDVYNSPHGVGYQIYYKENGAAHSVGYGPEAGDRTFTIEFPKPAPSATSTPVVE
jgi:hypothetical protein